MSMPLSRVCVPVFSQFLGSLVTLLEKAAEQAAARKIDPAVLLQARLFPDMFPLVRQVQLASDFAKGAAARLAGVPVPSWPDEEKTIPELVARVTRTLDFVQGVDRAAIDASVEREVSFKIGPTERIMKGGDYLLHNAMPHFFFHVTTAYDLLRHNGIEVGKRDYMGQVPGL